MSVLSDYGELVRRRNRAISGAAESCRLARLAEMARAEGDEAALLAAVHAQPADRLPLLVFADWLDERDREVEAKVARVLAGMVPPADLTVGARSLAAVFGLRAFTGPSRRGLGRHVAKNVPWFASVVPLHPEWVGLFEQGLDIEHFVRCMNDSATTRMFFARLWEATEDATHWHVSNWFRRGGDARVVVTIEKDTAAFSVRVLNATDSGVQGDAYQATQLLIQNTREQALNRPQDRQF